MEIIHKYFPKLTETQIKQFEALHSLYTLWNEKINVVSRKDIENLYERHILHSLAIAKFIEFTPGTSVMDLGTGGGFPAIPLAILYPKVNFHAIDGTAKKIKVVQIVINELGLTNVTAQQLRAEENKQKYDFILTRAVATLDKLILWSKRLINHKDPKNAMPNGLIALKGGSFEDESKGIHEYMEHYPLKDYFEEAFFDTKYLVYVQLS